MVKMFLRNHFITYLVVVPLPVAVALVVGDRDSLEPLHVPHLCNEHNMKRRFEVENMKIFVVSYYLPYEKCLFYRVTITLVQNLLLTSKQKFRFGLARAGQVKRNFCSEVNRRF